jgi:two-component system response regulator
MAQSTTGGSATEPWNVLLVEDNPGDVEMTERILQDSEFIVNINVAEDGEVALAHLRKEGEYASASQPDMIILDLGLPKIDGYQVLDALKADAALKDIPVMVLTSSTIDNNRLFVEGFLPDRYCRKPIDLPQFDKLVRELRFGVEIQQPKKKWWWPW